MTIPLWAPDGRPLVVGVDPSLEATGVAWSGGRLVRHGRAGLTVAKGRSVGQRGNEVRTLALELGNLVMAQGVPVLAIMEDIPTYKLDGYRAYVWWALANLLTAQGVAVIEVQPAEIKKYATGKGNSGKGAVVDAVARRMPFFDTGGDDNLADAAWACAMGSAVLGHPIADVPQTHRDALKPLLKRLELHPYLTTTEGNRS